MSWEIRQGDALERLREMPDESVQTVVTSPPYWGLRDYGTAEWEGGDSECDHQRQSSASRASSGLGVKDGRGPYGDQFAAMQGGTMAYGHECGKCGARRIDSQLGLEKTPEDYVANLLEVFREVRRVLRSDGTVWCNLGDSYATSGTRGHTDEGEFSHRKDALARTYRGRPSGLKEKDLCGIPWRVAFALQADGWWLRSEIIWAKKNCMPESVTDRPTRAHEQIFLLTKSARYFMDMDAVREGSVGQTPHDLTGPGYEAPGQTPQNGNRYEVSTVGRNLRSVWHLATQPYPKSHFAVFPTKLVEPCILAGSPPKCCGECGAPWERVVEVERIPRPTSGPTRGGGSHSHADLKGYSETGLGAALMTESRTLGFESPCLHDDDSGESVVLDPFAGSGTTGVVALRHDRSFIGIELNEDYCELARNRIRDDAPLLNTQLEAA